MFQVMSSFSESQASNGSLNRNLYIPTAKKHRKKEREGGMEGRRMEGKCYVIIMDMDNFINKCLIYPLHLDAMNSGKQHA